MALLDDGQRLAFGHRGGCPLGRALGIEVTFSRDLGRCVAVVSGASPDGNFPGVGGTARASHQSDPRVIGVQTTDATGAAAASDFSLAVLC